MKIQLLWILTAALALAACGKQEPPAPQEAEPPEAAAPVAEPEAAEMPAAPEAPTEPQAEIDVEFMHHMHAHAEQLDDLMFALADGDLDAAMTPAYWLSRHKTVSGVPEEWQQYVTGMREAASAVESASDLDTARAAAEEITVHCQGCHTAAGLTVVQ